MNKNQKWIVLFVALFLLTTGAFYAVWADHEEHKEWRWYEKIFDWDDDDDDDDDNDHNRGKKRRRYQKRDRNDSKHYGKHYLTPVNNPTYTEIPYILEKHNEIDPDVFKRESIGSLSNCPACHTTAGKGVYEDDYVQIPHLPFTVH